MPFSKKIQPLKPRLAKSVRLLKRSSLNLPHLICNHIIGKEHKIQHRITVGSVMMIMGVLVSKAGGGISIIILHYLFDVIGSSIHGIGLIPWIEYITQAVEKKNERFEAKLQAEKVMEFNQEEKEKKKENANTTTTPNIV